MQALGPLLVRASKLPLRASFSNSVSLIRHPISGVPRFGLSSSRCFASAAAEDGLSGLSIGELKKLLGERGVDYRDCLEKRDLVARLKAS